MVFDLVLNFGCLIGVHSETDYPDDCEGLSYVCDTFPDEEENTENGVDPFDTDSDVNSDEGACYDKRTTVCVMSEDTSPTLSNDTKRYLSYFKNILESSGNVCSRNSLEHPLPSTSRSPDHRPSKSSSMLYENAQLPQISMADVHRLSSSSGKIDKKSSWAQETLF